MSRNKALVVYLVGTFSQLLLVCLVVFFFNHFAIRSNLVNILGVMIGGISTALWGSIVAICYYEIDFWRGNRTIYLVSSFSDVF